MKSCVAFAVLLASFFAASAVAASIASSAREVTAVRQLKDLLHARNQLSLLQLRLAKEIQEKLSHLSPKTKRCAGVIGLPGSLDNCDNSINKDLVDLWAGGPGRRRMVLGGGASDNLDGQQVVDEWGNHDIYTNQNSAGKRGVLGIAGSSDNFDGQGAADARAQYNALNNPNTPGRKRRAVLFGDASDEVFEPLGEWELGPGKRGTLLGLAGGSDNFDGQGALDARNQYELFNSGRTPGKRSHE